MSTKKPPVANGPRDPGNLPNIMGKLDQARAAVKKAPQEVQDSIRILFESIEEFARVQTDLNRRLWYMRGSTPAKHGATHTPFSGVDPLPISTPLGLANSNLKGTVNTFLGGGAQFKRDVRVQVGGVDVGTRNKLNFSSGATAVDNPGTDAVDVTISEGADAEVFAWFLVGA